MNDCEIRYPILASADSTIVVEVLRTKLLHKHKYFLSFENFTGELQYVPNHPDKSRLNVEIDARSMACRDQRLSANKQRRVAKYAKDLVLNAATPSIQFSSQQISAKALRGFVVEGTLTVRGATQTLKMTVTFIASGADRLEIEGNLIIRFSEFGIKAPSSLFGMIRVSDQALVQFHMHMARTNTGK